MHFIVLIGETIKALWHLWHLPPAQLFLYESLCCDLSLVTTFTTGQQWGCRDAAGHTGFFWLREGINEELSEMEGSVCGCQCVLRAAYILPLLMVACATNTAWGSNVKLRRRKQGLALWWKPIELFECGKRWLWVFLPLRYSGTFTLLLSAV